MTAHQRPTRRCFVRNVICIRQRDQHGESNHFQTFNQIDQRRTNVSVRYLTDDRSDQGRTVSPRWFVPGGRLLRQTAMVVLDCASKAHPEVCDPWSCLKCLLPPALTGPAAPATPPSAPHLPHLLRACHTCHASSAPCRTCHLLCVCRTCRTCHPSSSTYLICPRGTRWDEPCRRDGSSRVDGPHVLPVETDSNGCRRVGSSRVDAC